MSSTHAPRPRKHLMTPGQPQPPQRYSTSLSSVQKWVMSTLAASTILHLAGGVVLAAMFVEDDRLDAQIGLLVISAAFGVIAVVTARLIHQKPPVSPWLALGLLPGVVGAFLVF